MQELHGLLKVLLITFPMLVVVTALFAYSWWTEHRKRTDAEAELEQALDETDWERLQRKFELREITASQKVSRHQVARAKDPESAHIRGQQQALEKLFQYLIDQEFIALVREDVPAKKNVKYTARMHVSRKAAEDVPVNELSGVSADELMVT